jgi:hypothetical protein
MSEKGDEPPKRVVVQVKRQRRLGIDLTLTPQDWLPDARNARLEFTARIYEFKEGKWEYPGQARKITFSFKEVSVEKGICLNYPKEDESNANPDLFFPEDDKRMKDFYFEDDRTDANKKCPNEVLKAKDNPAHEHHYQKASTKMPVTEAKVVVRCEDYGAFGILKAEAEDCETLNPRERDSGCSQEIGDNEVNIPRDDNGNNIADSAPHDADGAPANSDNDNFPVGDGLGDGLTNYEEYRGFIVGRASRRRFIVGGARRRRSHIRTSIDRKDIFIFDQDNLTTGIFHKSGLNINLIPGPDFYNGDSTDKNDAGPDPGKQVINFNHTSHHGGDQHGIRLVKIANPGLYGQMFGRDGAPGLPKDTNRVGINRDLCNRKGEHTNQLSSTIAHELGHSVKVWHHGEVSDFRTNPPTSKILPFQYLDKNGDPYDVKADGPHGVSSGVVNCIMRYTNCYYLWYHPDSGNPGSYFVEHNTNRDPGVVFCSSTVGNQCNDVVGFRNDASSDTWTNMAHEPPTRGDCRSRIKVKDW